MYLKNKAHSPEQSSNPFVVTRLPFLKSSNQKDIAESKKLMLKKLFLYVL